MYSKIQKVSSIQVLPLISAGAWLNIIRGVIFPPKIVYGKWCIMKHVLTKPMRAAARITSKRQPVDGRYDYD